MLRKPAGRRGQSGAGALALRLGEAGTVEAARGGRAWQRGESHPWTEGRKGHAERQEVQQAADHGGEHGNALQRRAPDGGVVPVMRAGDHEALQGIMMLRGEAPEFGKRGSVIRGGSIRPARDGWDWRGRMSGDALRGRAELVALGGSCATNFWACEDQKSHCVFPSEAARREARGRKTLTSHRFAMGACSLRLVREGCQRG